MKDEVISMPIKSWRFGRVFDRLLTKLDPGSDNTLLFGKRFGIEQALLWG